MVAFKNNVDSPSPSQNHPSRDDSYLLATKKQRKDKDDVLILSAFCAVLCGACENTKNFRISRCYKTIPSFKWHIQHCVNFDHLKENGKKSQSRKEILDAIKGAQIKFGADVSLGKIAELKKWEMVVR